MSKIEALISDKGSPVRDYFQHPAIFTFLMFVGEFLCFPLYHIIRLFQEEKKTRKKPLNIFMCAIPGICDILGSTLAYLGQNIMASSLSSMLGGFRIIVVALFSRVFFKKILYKHHIVGILLIFIGLIIVGFNAYLDDEQESSALGFVFLILSFMVTPIQIVIEEALFKEYEINPIQLIAYEGMTGVIISGILIFIYQEIPCTRSTKSGRSDVYPESAFCPYFRFEDYNVAINQIKDKPKIWNYMFASIISLCCVNFSSVALTKYLTGTIRSMFNVVYMGIIWTRNILIGNEQFNVIQLIGYIVSASGILMYNEFYVPSMFKLDYNTKENIKKREKYKKLSKED